MTEGFTAMNLKVTKFKSQPFERQPHKMVKHTQTVRLFEFLWTFCGVGA